MSTLHERIKERIDGVSIAVPKTAAALLAVVERHKPAPCCVGHFTCSACGSGRSWPIDCPDTMAIASALGVEIGETP